MFGFKEGSKKINDLPTEEEKKAAAESIANSSASVYPKPQSGEKYIPSWVCIFIFLLTVYFFACD